LTESDAPRSGARGVCVIAFGDAKEESSGTGERSREAAEQDSPGRKSLGKRNGLNRLPLGTVRDRDTDPGETTQFSLTLSSSRNQDVETPVPFYGRRHTQAIGRGAAQTRNISPLADLSYRKIKRHTPPRLLFRLYRDDRGKAVRRTTRNVRMDEPVMQRGTRIDLWPKFFRSAPLRATSSVAKCSIWCAIRKALPARTLGMFGG
jgi:hypothetical protein